MPLTGPSSYLSTVDEFVAHWALVNARLGGLGLTWANGTVSLAHLEGLRLELLARRQLVQKHLIVVALSSAEVEAARVALLVRLEQLSGRVRADAPGSKWARTLPRLPSTGSALARYLDVLYDASHLWSLYNEAETEFTLPGNYTQEMLQTQIDLLRGAGLAVQRAERDLLLARTDRNSTQDKIRDVLRDYRQAMPTWVSPGDPLLQGLPRLTPERGTTPKPVVVEASFDPLAKVAVLSWSKSEEPGTKRYSIRWSPGKVAEDYKTDDEEVLGSVPADGEREFRTSKGLLLPGGVSLFRLYVVNETDNEKGSETMVVRRAG